MNDSHSPPNQVVYVVDVGSPNAGSLGWARLELSGGKSPEGSTSIDSLVSCVRESLIAGDSVALGFESPLFLPEPEESADLCRSRRGEGNRSMFFGAGLAVTTLGLHLVPWILKSIAEGMESKPVARFAGWPSPPNSLFLFEAFVSGKAHARGGRDEHIKDACTAVDYFRQNAECLDEANAVTLDVGVEALSVVGAAVLWAGWSNDLSLIRRTVTVLKPPTPFDGDFSRLDDGGDPEPDTAPSGLKCPITGCDYQFRVGRSGWDSHVSAYGRHPDWEEDTEDPEKRKELFIREFADWFE